MIILNVTVNVNLRDEKMKIRNIAGLLQIIQRFERRQEMDLFDGSKISLVKMKKMHIIQNSNK